MKRLLIFIFLSLILVSEINSQIPKLRIDPSQAYGGTVSEYFDQVEYIPLETTKESLFGDVGQLCVTDSGFVVADYDTRVVLFFDKAGRFITKIKYSNDDIPNITYSKYYQNITVSVYKISNATLTKMYYDLKGRLVAKNKKVNLSDDTKFQYPLGSDYFFELNSCHIYNKKEIKDSALHLVSIYKNDTLKKSFLPVNPARDLGFCMLAGTLIMSKSQQSEPFYACLPIENYVYSINRDTVMPLFQFVFPKIRSYDADILQAKRASYLDSANKKNRADPQKVYAVTNIYFKNHLLFFKIMAQLYYISHNGSENELQYNFIYDTLSKKLVSIERLSPDTISAFLPIKGNLATTEGFIFADPYLYSTISSLNIFDAHEKNKDRNPQYPRVLQQYFKTQNRKSNPVIVKMKLRE